MKKWIPMLVAAALLASWVFADGSILAGAITVDKVITSSVASGSVAIQTTTGAKTCLGSAGVGCFTYTATGPAVLNSVATGPVALAWSPTTPTITGFGGTGAAVSFSNGTAMFDINVGTVAPGNTGTITLPTAANGWTCHCYNKTTTSALNDIIVTSDTATTCVIAQIVIATGGAANWAASDHLRCTAVGG